MSHGAASEAAVLKDQQSYSLIKKLKISEFSDGDESKMSDVDFYLETISYFSVDDILILLQLILL